jgi:hypothetical protein
VGAAAAAAAATRAYVQVQGCLACA